MEQVIQVTGLCVVGALLALVVKRGSPETALLLAVRGGDVGHPQRVFRVADVEPAGDLPRGEARHSQLAAKGCELVGRFAV